MTDRRHTAGILIGYVGFKNIDSISCECLILTTFVRAAKNNYYKQEHCLVALNGDHSLLEQKLVQLETIFHFKIFYQFCLVGTYWEIQSWGWAST